MQDYTSNVQDTVKQPKNKCESRRIDVQHAHKRYIIFQVDKVKLVKGYY